MKEKGYKLEKRKKKFAQSGIIVSVLIILLILSAIAIFWNVINRIIRDKSDDIDSSKLQIIADIDSFLLTQDHTNATIEVYRYADKTKISSVKFNFKALDDSVYSIENTTTPLQLETKVYLITNNSLGIENFTNIKFVSLYFIRDNNELTLLLDTEENKYINN